MTSSSETTIDVPRSAVLRLLDEGRKRLIGETEHGVECWWSGYIRALEHVLEMENE